MKSARSTQKKPEVTIIIPTYNRPEMLRRNLQYLQTQRWSNPILVVDSSVRESALTCEKVITEFRQTLSVRLLALDSATPLYAKLAAAVEHTNTPCVALCADDDFLVPDSVLVATRFLLDHPDYSLVCGYAITTTLYNGQLRIKLYPQGAVENESPVDRLTNLLGDFKSTLWEVYRRDTCLITMRRATEHTYQSIDGGFAFRFPELFAACVSVIEGKIGIIPQLLSVRQTPGTHKLYPEKIYGWPAIFAHENFLKHYQDFRDGIATVLKERAAIGIQEAKLIVDKTFLIYKERILNPRPHTILQKILAIIDTQWFRIMQEAKSPADFLHYELRAPMRWLRRSLSRDWRLFLPIRQLVLKYPEGISKNQ